MEEFHVDSTYKTNRLGYELFGIVANINGCGFPIAYMIFGVDETRVPENRRRPTRMDFIHRFFRCLHNNGLGPKFMFSDKDLGQINAIESVFGRFALRLCLWHLDHSVKLRFNESKTADPRYDAVAARRNYPFVSLNFLPSEDRSGKLCPDMVHREAILAMMREHYHMHPCIPIPGGMSQALVYIGVRYDFNVKTSWYPECRGNPAICCSGGLQILC